MPGALPAALGDIVLRDHAHKVLRALTDAHLPGEQNREVFPAALETAIDELARLNSTIARCATGPKTSLPLDALIDARASVLRAQHLVHDIQRTLHCTTPAAPASASAQPDQHPPPR